MKELKAKSMKQYYIRFFLIVLMIFYFGNFQTYAVETSLQNMVNEITEGDNYKNDFRDLADDPFWNFVKALILSFFVTTLCLIFLKVAGIIAVSWLVVFLPVLIPLVLFLILCIIFIVAVTNNGFI